MTLNIGWISGDSAFLVSDTSATSRRDPRHPLTSLGQPQGRSDGLAVEEIAAKVVPFGTHAAAALCGDARGGTAFVRDVLRRLSVGVSLDQALLSAGHSLRHQKPAFGAFVVTVARWDDGPKILQYRSDSLELVDVSSVGVVVEGSLRAPLVDAVRERILGLPGPAIHAQVVLGAAVSFLQSVAASEDLATDFVGGVFYGLCINETGRQWQPNILYVFYQNDAPTLDNPPMQLVSARMLDEVCVIGSSLSQQVRCLVHPGDHNTDRAAWTARWGDLLGTESAIRQSRLVAFIRTTGNSVLVLNNDGKHFWYSYDGHLGLAMSPALVARLRWKPETSDPRKFTLGLPFPSAPSGNL